MTEATVKMVLVMVIVHGHRCIDENANSTYSAFGFSPTFGGLWLCPNDRRF